MGFVIKEVQDCRVNLGPFTSQYRNEQFVHLTLTEDCLASGNDALRQLVNEFGPRSQNYAYTYRLSAPKAYAQCPRTGSGGHPVSDHVAAYLLDNDTKLFTTSEENSFIGGMFINRDDLEVITNYIEEAFPRANIENEVNKASHRP